jgi:hypothetical protein
MSVALNNWRLRSQRKSVSDATAEANLDCGNAIFNRVNKVNFMELNGALCSEKGFADQFGDLGRDSVNSERPRLVAVISHLSSDNPFWMRDWAIRLTCALCRPWPKSGYLTISCNKRGRNQPSGRIRLFTGTVAGYSRTLPRRLTCRHDTAEPWVNAFRIASRRWGSSISASFWDK